MDRWAETDRDFDGHDGTAGYARRPGLKWVGLLIAWVVVTGLLVAVHLTVLIWVVMVGLIAYVVYSVIRDTPPGAGAQPRRRASRDLEDNLYDDYDDYDDRDRFNAPPGWPEPPPGWTPPPGWQPNPAWPPAPPGWQFWLPPARQSRQGLRERGWRTERIERPHSHRSDSNGRQYRDSWP